MEYLTDKLVKPINPDVAKEMMDLWLEYENCATPESIFVKDGMFHFSSISPV